MVHWVQNVTNEYKMDTIKINIIKIRMNHKNEVIMEWCTCIGLTSKFYTQDNVIGGCQGGHSPGEPGKHGKVVEFKSGQGKNGKVRESVFLHSLWSITVSVVHAKSSGHCMECSGKVREFDHDWRVATLGRAVLQMGSRYRPRAPWQSWPADFYPYTRPLNCQFIGPYGPYLSRSEYLGIQRLQTFLLFLSRFTFLKFL